MKYIFLMVIISIGTLSFGQRNLSSKIVISSNKVFHYVGSIDGTSCQISVIDIKTNQLELNTIKFVELIDTFNAPQWDADANHISLLRLGVFVLNNVRGGILEYQLDKNGKIVYQHELHSEWIKNSFSSELFDCVVPDPLPLSQLIGYSRRRKANTSHYVEFRDFFCQDGSNFFTLIDDPFSKQTKLWKYTGEKIPYYRLDEEEINNKLLSNRERWQEVFSIPSKNNGKSVMAYPKGDKTYIISQDRELYLVGKKTKKLGTITRDLEKLTIIVNKDDESVGFCETELVDAWLKDTQKPINIRPIEELVAH
jgi:hypothetical protein